MKERSIIFSGEMVRAILEGRKTQTRRVIKPRPKHIWGFGVQNSTSIFAAHIRDSKLNDYWKKCPYGSPGDRLWVRETWTLGDIAIGEDPTIQIFYRADNADKTFQVDEVEADKYIQKFETLEELGNGGDNWQPSIHMPRLASRITLEIVSIRVERVQEISEEDAIAEGISKEAFPIDGLYFATQLYAEVWDSLNAKRGYGWDQNPWVWVIEFKRLGEGVEK